MARNKSHVYLNNKLLFLIFIYPLSIILPKTQYCLKNYKRKGTSKFSKNRLIWYW